jgi:hypothetical protein
MSGESQLRQIKDGPWCWQHKQMLTMISDIFDATNDVSSARTIYVALSEFASDNGSETFTESIAQIARRAAVSYSTAARLLNRLEKLKLIDIKRHCFPGTKERAPSTYSLGSMLGNGYLRLGNSRIRGPFPKGRKETENKRKKGESNSSSSGKKWAVSKPKLPAPFYPQLPPKRELTDEELAEHWRIVKEEVAMLKAKFKMP